MPEPEIRQIWEGRKGMDQEGREEERRRIEQEQGAAVRGEWRLEGRKGESRKKEERMGGKRREEERVGWHLPCLPAARSSGEMRVRQEQRPSRAGGSCF